MPVAARTSKKHSSHVWEVKERSLGELSNVLKCWWALKTIKTISAHHQQPGEVYWSMQPLTWNRLIHGDFLPSSARLKFYLCSAQRNPQMFLTTTQYHFQCCWWKKERTLNERASLWSTLTRRSAFLLQHARACPCIVKHSVDLYCLYNLLAWHDSMPALCLTPCFTSF